MSLIAAILIALSACSHALWNLLGKKRNPSVAFFFCTVTGAALFLSPVHFFYFSRLSNLPRFFWELICWTALAQSLYFIGLAGAYSRGHVSLVYPLARAIPVAAIAILNIIAGKGDQISLPALVGMFLITAGCILLPMRHFSDLTLRNYFNLCSLFILAAAVGTTAYTIIDDAGLRILREDPSTSLSALEAALVYISLQTAASIPPMLFAASCSALARKRVLIVIKKDLGYAFLTGVVISITYLLVLAAMAFVSNVSYAAAFRQLSIPITALAGIFWLKEPGNLPKYTGLVVLLVGLSLVLI